MIKSYQLNTYIKYTESKGRGVFASKEIDEDEIVEESPLLVLSPEDSLAIEGTMLSCYQYYFSENQVALGLGNTSLYNHSSIPNAEFSIDDETKTVTIQALRHIAKDEEIVVDYGYDVTEVNVDNYKEEASE
jgi:tRNA-specific adenosine deaminase 3